MLRRRRLQGRSHKDATAATRDTHRPRGKVELMNDRINIGPEGTNRRAPFGKCCLVSLRRRRAGSRIPSGHPRLPGSGRPVERCFDPVVGVGRQRHCGQVRAHPEDSPRRRTAPRHFSSFLQGVLRVLYACESGRPGPQETRGPAGAPPVPEIPAPESHNGGRGHL